MSFPYLLLGAQAAGIGLNIYGNSQANRIEKLGLELDERQMNIRMKQEGLMASEQTLGDLERLRENLASQRAILGARGQMPGVGSAKTIEQASIRNQKQEENARKVSLGFRESYMKSMSNMRRIDAAGSRAMRGTQLVGQSLNMFSFNQVFGNGSGSLSTSSSATQVNNQAPPLLRRGV